MPNYTRMCQNICTVGAGVKLLAQNTQRIPRGSRNVAVKTPAENAVKRVKSQVIRRSVNPMFKCSTRYKYDESVYHSSNNALTHSISPSTSRGPSRLPTETRVGSSVRWRCMAGSQISQMCCTWSVYQTLKCFKVCKTAKGHTLEHTLESCSWRKTCVVFRCGLKAESSAWFWFAQGAQESYREGCQSSWGRVKPLH